MNNKLSFINGVQGQQRQEDAYTRYRREHGLLNDQQNEEQPGFLESAWQGAKAQAAGVIGGQADMLNLYTGIGKDTADYMQKVQQDNARKKEYSWAEMVPFASDYWTNSQGASYDVGGGLGSSAALMGETLAVGALGSAAGLGGIGASLTGAIGTRAAAAGLPWVSRILGRPAGKLLIANIMSTPFEAVSEGGNKAREIKEAGGDEEAQKSGALKSTALNTALLTFTNTLESTGLGKLIGQAGGKDKFMQVMKGVVGDAMQNAYEEGAQTTIGEYVDNQNKGVLSIVNPLAWSEDARNAAAVGGVTGAAMGGGAVVGGKAINKVLGKAGDSAETFTNEESADNEGADADEKERFINAIAGQESGGDYGAVNERTGASGKYQIMPENWPQWAEEAGLGSDAEMTPENQETVARYKLGEYYDKYGAEGAAQAWYAGEGSFDYDEEALNRKQGNGDEPSIREYVDSVMQRMGNQLNTEAVREENVVAADNAEEGIEEKPFEDVDLSKKNNKAEESVETESNDIDYGEGAEYLGANPRVSFATADNERASIGANTQRLGNKRIQNDPAAFAKYNDKKKFLQLIEKVRNTHAAKKQKALDYAWYLKEHERTQGTNQPVNNEMVQRALGDKKVELLTERAVAGNPAAQRAFENMSPAVRQSLLNRKADRLARENEREAVKQYGDVAKEPFMPQQYLNDPELYMKAYERQQQKKDVGAAREPFMPSAAYTRMTNPQARSYYNGQTARALAAQNAVQGEALASVSPTADNAPSFLRGKDVQSFREQTLPQIRQQYQKAQQQGRLGRRAQLLSPNNAVRKEISPAARQWVKENKKKKTLAQWVKDLKSEILATYPDNPIDGCKQELKAARDDYRLLLEPIVTKMENGMGNGVSVIYVDENGNPTTEEYAHRGIRASNNMPWYSRYYKENQARPSKTKLYEIARDIYLGDNKYGVEGESWYDGSPDASAELVRRSEEIGYFDTLIKAYEKVQQELVEDKQNGKGNNQTEQKRTESENNNENAVSGRDTQEQADNVGERENSEVEAVENKKAPALAEKQSVPDETLKNISELKYEDIADLITKTDLNKQLVGKSKQELFNIARNDIKNKLGKQYFDPLNNIIYFAPGNTETVDGYTLHLIAGQGKPIEDIRVQRVLGVLLADKTITKPWAIVRQKNGRKMYLAIYQGANNMTNGLVIGVEEGQNGRVVTSTLTVDQKGDKKAALREFKKRISGADEVLYIWEGLTGRPRPSADQRASQSDAKLRPSGENIITQNAEGVKEEQPSLNGETNSIDTRGAADVNQIVDELAQSNTEKAKGNKKAPALAEGYTTESDRKLAEAQKREFIIKPESKIKKETSLYSKRPNLTTATDNGVVIDESNRKVGVAPSRANPTKADVSFTADSITQAAVESKMNSAFPSAGIVVDVHFNNDKNGIEIKFNGKPSADVLQKLKSAKFRWSSKQKLWYAKQNAQTMEVAKAFGYKEANASDSGKTDAPNKADTKFVDLIETFGNRIGEDKILTPSEAEKIFGKDRLNDGQIVLHLPKRDLYYIVYQYDESDTAKHGMKYHVDAFDKNAVLNSENTFDAKNDYTVADRIRYPKKDAQESDVAKRAEKLIDNSTEVTPPAAKPQRFDGERAKKSLDALIGRKKKAEPQQNDVIPKLVNVFNEDELDAEITKAKAEMSKLSANPMFNPVLMKSLFKIGGIYLQKGVNKFAAWAQNMVDVMGESVRPFLPAVWSSLKKYPQGQKFNDDVMSAVMEYVGDGVDQGKSLSVIRREFTDDYGEEYLGYVDAAYEGIKEYPTEIADNVVELKQEKATKEADDNGEIVRRETARADSDAAGARPDTGRSSVSGSVSAPQAQGDAGTGAVERGVPAQVTEKKLAPAQKKAAKAKEVPGHNFTITEEENIGKGGPKAKYKDNVEAIRLLKQLEAENRLATPEEQKVLARYVGWGGLSPVFNTYGRGAEQWKNEQRELQELLTSEEYNAARASVNNAHYTSPEVIKGVWGIVDRLGFKGGRVLEPSMGIGNFYGMMPETMRSKSALNGVELDSITGRIARQLYQKANVEISGFEQTKYPDNFFDLVVSNVPFGDYKLNDPKYNKYKFNIHNYFFAKAVDQTRPGGLVCFITSTGTMQSGADSLRLRQLLQNKVDFIGALRLPNTAFKENAGTDVTTDLIILQKREAGAEAGQNNQQWLNTVDSGVRAKYGDKALGINEYYSQHPEMMLGKLVEDKLYGGRLALDGTGVDIAAEMAKRVNSFPANIYKPLTSKRNLDSVESAKAAFLAPAKMRYNAYAEQGGKVYQNINGKMVELPQSEQKKALDYVALRDVTKEILAAQIDPATKDDSLKSLRDKLNKVYDVFVAKHGYINDSKNIKALAADPEYGVIAAIEEYKYDKKTKVAEAKKRDIFTKRTVNAIVQVDKADNPADALALSLSNTGTVNVDYMTQLLGKKPQEVVNSLEGLIYENPATRAYETADEYLSGNVREKLEYAREAAKQDKAFEKNVKELEKVQPKDIAPEEISVSLGTPWIPAADVEAFAAKLLDMYKPPFSVKFVPQLGSWTVSWNKGWTIDQAKRGTKNTTTWGTQRRDFKDILDDALNQRSPVIYDTDFQGNKTVNQKETTLAQQKIREVQNEFKKWIWSDKERTERLAAYYNRNYNNWRLREYNGSHLTMPGYSAVEAQLYPHQKDAIWRMMQRGNTLLAHCVGAGKTWTMQAGAMEMKRLGIIKKPMFVIPNHMLQQFENEFRRIYPNAKLLTISSDTLPDVTIPNAKKLNKNELERRRAAKNAARQSTLGRIATEDWDGIIISHNMFKRIPMSDKAYADFYRDQINEMREAIIALNSDNDQSSNRLVKELEKKAKSLEEKLKQAVNEENKDIVIPFEQLGVDQLFVDEADMFKNLFFVTKMTRIAGLSNTNSQRSTDMFMKTQYLTKTNGGRGVVFATGTPISNTMAEMFTMLRYLDMQGLKEKNMAFFDNWAANFANRETTIERSPDGQGYRQTEKFTSFTNMPELIKMFRKVADVKTQEDLHLDIPKLKNGKPTIVEIEPNDALTNYIKNVIADRADKIHNRRVDPSQDNMLKLTGDLRKASLDMRLVDPTVPAQVAESKLKAVADRTYDKYVETTDVQGAQLIFCDLSTPKAASDKVSESDTETKEAAEDSENVTAYEEIKKMLLKKGIPSKEIAFIHDAKTKEQKEELFAKVRAGDVRVLIGSTEKMGAGTNIQDKLVALHHVDAPWRPRDIEQREGRILRKGNQNKEVEIFNYVTKDSFDANMWEKLKNKASMINQAMSNNLSGRTIEDADANVLTFAEVEALASGNPLMAERTMVSAELNKYETLHAAYTRAQAQAARKAEALPIQIKQAELAIKQGKADIKKRIDITKDNFNITLGKKTYTNRAEAKAALEKLVGNYNNELGGVVGKVGGFVLRLRLVKAGQLFSSNERAYRASEDAVRAELVGENVYNSEPSLQSIEYNVMHGPERVVDAAERSKSGLEKELADVTKELNKPFEYEGKYNELKKRSAEIDKELGIGEEDAPKFSVSDEATAQRTFAEVETEARAAFPNAKEVQYEGNNIIFAMPNGKKIRVSIDDEIIINDEARRQHNIDADTDAVAEGYWQKLDNASIDGVLALSKEGRKGTAFHEALHAAMDLALTTKEKSVLEKHYQKVAEEKGIDLEEAIADGYKEWVLARQNGRGTMLGKLFQKMQDFWHKVKALLTGMADAHEVMRRLESGEVWERGRDTSGSKGKLFSLFSNEEQSKWKEYGSKFKDNVAKALNGEIKSNTVIKVCDTPMILKELGVPDLPIKMRIGLAANTTKAKGEARHAHGLTSDMLEQIPQALNEPVFVIKSATVAGDIIVFTDIKDSEGHSVIVPLAIQKDIGNQNVANVIKSIYGRDNEDLFVTKNVLAENVLYANTEKSPAWLTAFRLQLPLLITKQSSFIENSISDKLQKGNTGNVTGTSERIRASIAQAISSADTSLNQIPAVFKKIPWKTGTVNIDIGGGRFDKATDFVKEKGVENIVFDPFNRDYEHNSKAFERVKQGGDTVTVANVLNVIAESDARDNVILQAARALKANGTAYFAIYEGSRDGVGKTTTKVWQNNMKTADYMPEVKKHFAEVHKAGNVIIAKKPILSEAEKAVWSMDDTFTHTVKYSAREAAKPLTVSEKVAKAFTNTERKGTVQTIKDWINNKRKNIYSDWIDKNDSLHGFDEAMQMGLGRKLKENELLYNKAQTMAANSAGMANSLIEGGRNNIAAINKRLKNKKLKYQVTLSMVLNQINRTKMDKAHPGWLAKHSEFSSWVDAFGAYLGCNRLLEMNQLAKKEGEAYKLPNGMTEADLKNFINSAPKEFKQAAEMYYMFNDNVLTVMEDAGLISDKVHEELNTKYKYYCPLMRDFSDTAAADAFIGGLGNGGRGIGNVSTPLKRISIEGSERNVLNPLESTIKAVSVVCNRAERNKVGQMAVNMATEAGLENLVVEVPGGKSDPKNCIFTVMENGKKVAYQTTQDLYGPIAGYNEAAAGMVFGVARNAARLLRAGATTSPSFILRNLIRDTIFAGISSQNGFVPIIDTIRGGYALLKNKEMRAEFDAAGVTQFNFYGSSEAIAKSLDEMAGGKKWQEYGPADIWRAFMKYPAFVSELAESSTRMGEFLKARQKGKDIDAAARAARELTLDFSRSGITGEKVNQIVPFFNACLQGGDKLYRLLRDDFVHTALKLTQYIVIPSLILWCLNHDEDWYKELDPAIKNTNWCLPGGIRVPKPQEVGVLFGSGIEAMLDKASGKDKEALWNWADTFIDNMKPGIIPTVFLPILEWQANYSYFRNQPLVNRRLQQLPDEQQFTNSTSEASKALGRVTGLSPVKIDNTIRGYTGTMGMFLWGAPDMLAAEKQNLPAKRWSEIQFFRDFNVTEMNQNRSVNDFYELLEKANKKHAGYGVKGKPTKAVQSVRIAGKLISDLNKDIQGITNGRLSSEEKRTRIDKKRAQIKRIAQLALSKYGKYFE